MPTAHHFCKAVNTNGLVLVSEHHKGGNDLAVIFDKEWDSLTGFDNQLSAIPHYQIHPEMLPFIGRHYPETRILILGESHYLSNEESEETKQMRDWYKRPTQDFSFKWPSNFDTRGVVHNYLTGWRSKASTMFSKPAKALIEAWGLKDVNDSEAFTGFAFFNYFQRPASYSGSSISLTKEDEEQAASILSQLIKILKPNKVVFLSKKAFNSYYRQVREVDSNLIEYVYHPTSSYWNDEDGGKQLCGILSSMKRYGGFSANGFLTLERANQMLSSSSYWFIQKGQKRFHSGIITYRIYQDSNDPASVSEVAWYLVEDNKRFGIGYVVQSKILWIWDYNNKRYMDDTDIKKHPKLIELYQDVQRLIFLL